MILAPASSACRCERVYPEAMTEERDGKPALVSFEGVIRPQKRFNVRKSGL